MVRRAYPGRPSAISNRRSPDDGRRQSAEAEKQQIGPTPFADTGGCRGDLHRRAEVLVPWFLAVVSGMSYLAPMPPTFCRASTQSWLCDQRFSSRCRQHSLAVPLYAQSSAASFKAGDARLPRLRAGLSSWSVPISCVHVQDRIMYRLERRAFVVRATTRAPAWMDAERPVSAYLHRIATTTCELPDLGGCIQLTSLPINERPTEPSWLGCGRRPDRRPRRRGRLDRYG